MNHKGGSKASSELLIEMVLAADAAIKDPNIENQKRADLAVAKVWASEREAAVIDERGKFSHIPAFLRQEFVRACDAYLADPSKENEALVERLWTKLEADRIKLTKPNLSLVRFAGVAAALAALLILAWGIASYVLPSLITTPTPAVTVTSATVQVIPGDAEITVLVSNADPPFSYTNVNNEAVGWSYDTVNEICKRVNCVPTFVEMPWDGMLQAIANGEYDMVADGLTLTAEQSNRVNFSVAYGELSHTILVRADEGRFTSADELKAGNFRIGVQAETPSAQVANELVEADRVIAFESVTAAIAALNAGEVDAVITEDSVSLSDSVKKLSDELAPEQYAFAFAPNSDWLARFNAAINEMRADGTLIELLDKWGLA